MSKKRTASSELNSDNWNVEEEPEEAGTFKSVDADVLKKRVIKVAKRRCSKPNTDNSKLFSGFSGFGSTNTSTPIAKNTSTFSFLKNLNGQGNSTDNKTTTSLLPSSTSTSVESKLQDSKPSKESLQSTKIKALNESILDWITKWVSENPTCVLTPVFRDYEKHLENIKSEVDNKEESKPKENIPTFTFNFTPNSNTSLKKDTGSSPSKNDTKLELPKAQEKTKAAWPAPMFNLPPMLSGTKSTFFQNVSTPGTSETPKDSTHDQDDGEDETPPVNDFKPIKEDDAVYTQKVKVFFKSDEAYVNKGVGNLYIKETTNDKDDKIYQAIVRADNSVGNILFNIRITKDIPTKRVGKNNVMLVCIATPHDKVPTPVLLRVKTGEEADQLLAEINKYQ